MALKSLSPSPCSKMDFTLWLTTRDASAYTPTVPRPLRCPRPKKEKNLGTQSGFQLAVESYKVEYTSCNLEIWSCIAVCHLSCLSLTVTQLAQLCQLNSLDSWVDYLSQQSKPCSNPHQMTFDFVSHSHSYHMNMT